jgi:hypothetical protein
MSYDKSLHFAIRSPIFCILFGLLRPTLRIIRPFQALPFAHYTGLHSLLMKAASSSFHPPVQSCQSAYFNRQGRYRPLSDLNVSWSSSRLYGVIGNAATQCFDFAQPSTKKQHYSLLITHYSLLITHYSFP